MVPTDIFLPLTAHNEHFSDDHDEDRASASCARGFGRCIRTTALWSVFTKQV